MNEKFIEFVKNLMCLLGFHDWVCTSYHTTKTGKQLDYVRQYRCNWCQKQKQRKA